MQTIAHNGTALCKPVHVMHLRVAPRGAHRQQKSRSPKAPAVQLVVCPDKRQKTKIEARPLASQLCATNCHAAAGNRLRAPSYALRRGRTVKSRTCARMLDICIPFSCDRYGKTSATN